MTAYAGVDAARPIDAHNQKGYTKTATSVPAPSLSTTRPGTLLLGLFAGDGGGATWTAPASMTEVADLAGGDRSQAVTQTAMPSAGSTGQRTAIASRSLSSSVGALVALNPAASPPPPPPPPPPTGAVGLIVDTDMFSSADDVGALATAFGLQLRGEANVLAVTVNTRTSRPTVARNSWRCVAAIISFYGAAGIPIGTHKPDDGTATNIVDWAGPCASLAPSSTPTPGAAVDVLRRTLAGQPDHSVVIASAGYFGNLSDLLNSPGDAISPLSGRDLVALKVNRLVSMGGGYPSRSGETNLSGDPAAASNVASNWPTKIVWSGYEVGDAIHTGQTISSTHPSLSPVRKAYEAFVGPNNWIYSYDLTAVYHAVRPQDTQLSEVGPGTNAVNSSGGNVFTTGPGSQYYLRLGSASAVDASIEALLDTLPSSTPPPPPPSGETFADDFSGSALDPARWTTQLDGSTVATAGGELQISHTGGAWTRAAVQSAAPVSLTGKAVRVQVNRAANDGRGGAAYGETSVLVQRDGTHYAEFFFAGGSLSAWVNRGAGSINLTPSWPAYNPTAMRWVRFREAGGTLFYEYASGDTTPGTWTALASTPVPFDTGSATFRIVAGANTATTDVARFDNVAAS
jgi:inosine-uridine nucleoside N-ribohydrolase